MEEDNRQEWTFTLYGFDNSGKATREVTRCVCVRRPLEGRWQQTGNHARASTLGQAEPTPGWQERLAPFMGQACGGREGSTAGPGSPAEPARVRVRSCARLLSVQFLAEPCVPVSAPASSPSPPQGGEGPRGAPGTLLACASRRGKVPLKGSRHVG